MITKDFVIVSAYTKDTNYAKIIKNLESDCLKLKIPYHFIEYNSVGVWVENTMLKPKIILSDWEELKYFYKNLIWIDADARINSYPKYFSELNDQQKDFSVFQMGSISRVTSGTIFIRLNDKMKEFVESWRDICQTTKQRLGDQQCLRELISKGIYQKLNINYKSLPYSYCYIFDDTLRKLEPKIEPLTGIPVVCHMQASRDRKNAKST